MRPDGPLFGQGGAELTTLERTNKLDEMLEKGARPPAPHRLLSYWHSQSLQWRKRTLPPLPSRRERRTRPRVAALATLSPTVVASARPRARARRRRCWQRTHWAGDRCPRTPRPPLPARCPPPLPRLPPNCLPNADRMTTIPPTTISSWAKANTGSWDRPTSSLRTTPRWKRYGRRDCSSYNTLRVVDDRALCTDGRSL